MGRTGGRATFLTNKIQLDVTTVIKEAVKNLDHLINRSNTVPGAPNLIYLSHLELIVQQYEFISGLCRKYSEYDELTTLQFQTRWRVQEEFDILVGIVNSTTVPMEPTFVDHLNRIYQAGSEYFDFSFDQHVKDQMIIAKLSIPG